MAEKLGGEVGVEKSSEAVEDGYQRLRRRSTSGGPGVSSADGEGRRQSVTGAPGAGKGAAAPRRDNRGEGAARSAGGGGKASSARTKKTGGLWGRFRINLLASAPEHGLKTRLSLLRDLVNFGKTPEEKDYINPAFLKRGEEIFYGPISRFVLPLRRLYAGLERSPLKRKLPPFYLSLLNIVSGWKIKRLSEELARLQRAPRRITWKECALLCREIYTPIVRLSRIDRENHLKKALERLYHIRLLEIPAGSREEKELFQLYSGAVTALDEVFEHTAYICYPLLLKFCYSDRLDYINFMSRQRERILSFLQLSEQDLILPEEVQLPALEEAKSGTVEEPAGREAEALLPLEVQSGLSLLNRMYPQAGWDCLDIFPDLFPYYKPILGFRRGADLIAPDDPLLAVYTLLLILQELFYGFRGIPIDSAAGEEVAALWERIQSASDNWYLFTDKLIGQIYLPSLQEYSRLVEKERSDDAFADKLAADLYWVKHRYLLPHLDTAPLKGRKFTLPKNLPRLYETAEQLHRRLAALLARTETAPPEGWHDAALFAVENYSSIRLQRILSFEGQTLTHKLLLEKVLLLVGLLDYLINDKSSFFYRQESPRPFRQDPVYAGRPLYTVNGLDTDRILKRADTAVEQGSTEEVSEGSLIKPTDGITGFYRETTLSGHLEVLIRGQEKSGIPFLLLYLDLEGFSALELNLGRERLAEILRETAEVMKPFIGSSDIPCRGREGLFYLLFRDKPLKEGFSAAKAILTELYRRKRKIWITLLPHREGQSAGDFLELAETGLRKARGAAAPAMAVYDAAAGEYKIIRSQQKSEEKE